MEESFDDEVNRLSSSMDGEFLGRLDRLKIDLMKWVDEICHKRNELKKNLTEKFEELIQAKVDDEGLAQMIDTKIQLNLEVRANWLQVGDKNTKFFHNVATSWRRRNFIRCLEDEFGRETCEEGK
ncbi:hypothetical protein EPI10_024165 [Gossypium australe]|uniref:Uncharacterized protein n=1 Tax=Gossypium australe TaxID=47621 RepID=A0A5B6VXU8_9ROSI|nr:hypothetical protein EPI10_024165 [Gossypium australe]